MRNSGTVSEEEEEDDEEGSMMDEVEAQESRGGTRVARAKKEAHSKAPSLNENHAALALEVSPALQTLVIACHSEPYTNSFPILSTSA